MSLELQVFFNGVWLSREDMDKVSKRFENLPKPKFKIFNFNKGE